ncbi:MAG TPA: hypothetical protein VE133_00880 [Candidatus Sulfotelmatobacter sp.]|nr:hypothetical protein [Candidatus Sulfotelmatobacter sp.]
MSWKNTELSLRLVALLLIVGGVAGVGIALWTEIQLLISKGSGSGPAALFGVVAVIFGFSTWVGIELWQRKPRAFKWAVPLLVAQLPNVSLPGFSYQFYTALSCCVLWNQPNTTLGFEFEFASAIRFLISRDIQEIIFGINLVPIVALYLLGKAKERAAGPGLLVLDERSE